MPETKPTLLIDVEFYEAIISDPEISPDQKRQIIEIIGTIVLEFIDIGFGVHPVQQAQGSIAQKWADEHLAIIQDQNVTSLTTGGAE